MKLLRNLPWWRGLRRLAVGRGRGMPHAYTVTVPAPLSAPNNVVELRRAATETHPAQPLPRVANG